MNIIILTQDDSIGKNIYRISDGRFTHIQKVLKSQIGDFLEIGLLNGQLGTAKLIEKSNSQIILKIDNFKISDTKLPTIDIICALPRPQTLKKILNTIATMGVNRLYLIRSEKVEKSYFHSPLLEEKHYTKYVIEGLAQGKRTKPPKISIHNKFKEFFNNYITEENTSSIRLLAHPDNSIYLGKESLINSEQITIAIGPEGGWNEYEINFMEARGFKRFKLSENILRVETAVTAALAQVELLLQNK